MIFYFPIFSQNLIDIDLLLSKCQLKVPYFTKIDIFHQKKKKKKKKKKRFNKLVYSINTIIKCGIRQPVKFH